MKPFPLSIDTPLVRAALDGATKAHAGQFRKDGKTPYIEHPIAAAQIGISLFDREIGRCSYNGNRHLEMLVALILSHDRSEDVEGETPQTVLASFAQHLDEPGRHLMERLLHAIDKNNHADYLAYVVACKRHWMTCYAKRSDLKHNISDLKPGSLRDKYALSLYILESV